MMERLYSSTFSQDPCPETLYNHLVTNYPGATYFSAYEAGFSGFWIHHLLTGYGIHSIVVNPADIPTTSKEKVQKEDAQDSRKIARSLKNQELQPIYVPSLEFLGERSLLRFRKAMVNDTTRIKNRIKCCLHFNGIKIPAGINTPKWNKKFKDWLAGLEPDTANKQTLDGHLSCLVHLRQSTSKVTRQIRILSKTEKHELFVRLLVTIPGIGLVTAMTILTELENIIRFKSLERLCSFIGLVPSTNSSGDSERTGDMTPRGHPVRRSALIESACGGKKGSRTGQIPQPVLQKHGPQQGHNQDCQKTCKQNKVRAQKQTAICSWSRQINQYL